MGSYLDFFEGNFGPLVLAREFLEGVGKWPRVRSEMIELLTDRNEARDGSFRGWQEYLVMTAHIYDKRPDGR